MAAVGQVAGVPETASGIDRGGPGWSCRSMGPIGFAFFTVAGGSMRARRWYKAILVAWLFTGLPVLAVVAAHVWAGGGLRPNLFHPFEPVPWEFAWALMALPVILAPFGLHRNAPSP